MKNRVIGVIFLLVLAGVGYWGFNTFAAPGTRPTSTPVAAVKSTAKATGAEGTIVPVQYTTLAFKMSGRVSEIPIHEGDTVKAGSVLARLDDTLLKAQVLQAQAALNVAQKQLAQLRAGATSEERKAAQNALVAARAAYDKVKAGPTADDLAVLKANMENAQAALAQAQFRYDRIGGASNPFAGAAPEALALQQAWNASLAAQAAYRSALSHPTESELKAAESAVTQAESAVARLDPTPETIALSQAQVDQAQAALDFAQVAAKDAVLVAPFDGTIGAISIHLGHVVTPSAPSITFGNLTHLQVETTDLAEVDVSQVAVGSEAQITVDAFPGKTFRGKVTSIAPLANDYRGDKVYKVTLAFLDSPTDLRWGMTTSVEIENGR